MGLLEKDGIAISTWGAYNNAELDFKHFFFAEYDTPEDMIEDIEMFAYSIDEDPEIFICDTENYSGLLDGVEDTTSYVRLVNDYFKVIDYVDKVGLELLPIVKMIEGDWNFDYLGEYMEFTQENINMFYQDPYEAILSFAGNPENNAKHGFFRFDGYGNIETVSHTELSYELSENKQEILKTLAERL